MLNLLSAIRMADQYEIDSYNLKIHLHLANTFLSLGFALQSLTILEGISMQFLILFQKLNYF